MFKVMNNCIIQKAIASLITNVYFSENYFELRSEIKMKLNLCETDMRILDKFYEKNKVKFTAASRILRKSRWNKIKSSLPIIVNNISPYKLDEIWSEYLRAKGLVNDLPKNPLLESICFSVFLEKTSYLTTIEKNIVRYERIRNEVTLIHHEKIDDGNLIKSYEFIHSNIENLSGYICKCARIEKFEYDIANVIYKRNRLENCKPKLEDSFVLYFKNQKEEGIGTMRITSDAGGIIENIIQNKNLCHVFQHFVDKVSKDDFIGFLKSVEKQGVITFYQSEEVR